MNNIETYNIVNIKDLDDKHYYTVVRVIDDINFVELHYNKSKPQLEYGTKIADGEWENILENVDWFSLDMTDEELIDKLLHIFKEKFLDEEIEL